MLFTLALMVIPTRAFPTLFSIRNKVQRPSRFTADDLKNLKYSPRVLTRAILGKSMKDGLLSSYGRNEALTSASAAALKNFLSVSRRHTSAKTVGLSSLFAWRLKCAFHGLILYSQKLWKIGFTGSLGYLSTKLSTKPFALLKVHASFPTLNSIGIDLHESNEPLGLHVPSHFAKPSWC